MIPLEAEAAPPLAAPAPSVEAPVETVIVTGELLRRPAERTTSSVSVHSGEEIERSTARDVYDVIAATPNARLEDSDYGVGGITLRGIGSYGASGSGAYAAYSTSSAIVFDGVGLPRSALSYADLSAFDLASVEIFRGPQSTSQGRNAMAGAVIVNTAEPQIDSSFSPFLRGRFAGGNDDQQQYAGAVGTTLWPDRLAVRVVGDDRRDGGDIDNRTRDEDDWARRRSRSTRVRASLRPSGIGSAYEALVSFADLRRYQGSTYVPQSEERARASLSNAPQDYDNHSQLGSLDQRLRLGERWRVRAISAYIRSETQSRFDIDYSADDQGATLQNEDAHAFSQELRLDYSGERLRGSFGAYYYKDSNGDDSTGHININGLLQASGFCGAQILCTAPLGNILFGSGSPSHVEDMALFGEVDWLLTDRLTLTGGARVDREKNDRVISSHYTGDTPVATAIVGLLGSAGVLPADGETKVSREFSDVLPKLAASYEVFDGWFAGAAYSEGYRPGGDGYNQVSGRHFSFDSEQTRNYELSFKGRYRPWHLDAALNLFHTRWDDMQIQLGSGVDNYMGNAGPAYIRGGELELSWQPWRVLRVVGGYGIAYGRFGDDVIVADGADLSGNHLPRAPDYTAALALEWTPWPALLIRPDVQWTGKAAAAADNAPPHELPSYALVNLSLRWSAGHFTLFFTGSNLTDARYRKDANNYAFNGTEVVSLGDSRRIAGGLEFMF
ncbi:TonB-dependent receptor [Solimonas soli]|uniref:TonB-dependent receptor n=1 Tax=Solimonas soli TaxID=413479 RepID=UPI001FE07FD0|nr:TonB-dependent receptor [Solimonas soli]